MTHTTDNPATLVGALQDRVHEDAGPYRAGISHRATHTTRELIKELFDRAVVDYPFRMLLVAALRRLETLELNYSCCKAELAQAQADGKAAQKGAERYRFLLGAAIDAVRGKGDQ